jgi:hypothetical protein
MRIKTYALVISGIFAAILTSLSCAMESGAAKWRPLQGQDTQQANWNDFSHLSVQNVRPGLDPWREGKRYAQLRSQSYRFRPMEREPRGTASLKGIYRPAQFEIPNHYVYRPLQVKRNRNLVDQQRLRRPTGRGMHVYGYTPSPIPYSGLAVPSSESFRYPDRYRRDYAERLADRDFGQPIASRYPNSQGDPSPRYSGQVPFDELRFRPLKRSKWDGYHGRSDRYAADPGSVPNYQSWPPDWGCQYGMQSGWYPRMPMPHPGMQQAMRRAKMPNRYGTNWYDGRGDGEGAWY